MKKKKKTKNENRKGKKESKTIFLTEKEWNIIKYKFCLSYIKMKFGENTILIYNVDFNKMLTSNKVSFSKTGFKYFIGYKYGKKN